MSTRPSVVATLQSRTSSSPAIKIDSLCAARLALALVCEFCDSLGLSATRSVLTAETGLQPAELAAVAPHGPPELASRLGLPPSLYNPPASPHSPFSVAMGGGNGRGGGAGSGPVRPGGAAAPPMPVPVSVLGSLISAAAAGRLTVPAPPQSPRASLPHAAAAIGPDGRSVSTGSLGSINSSSGGGGSTSGLQFGQGRQQPQTGHTGSPWAGGLGGATRPPSPPAVPATAAAMLHSPNSASPPPSAYPSSPGYAPSSSTAAAGGGGGRVSPLREAGLGTRSPRQQGSQYRGAGAGAASMSEQPVFQENRQQHNHSAGNIDEAASSDDDDDSDLYLRVRASGVSSSVRAALGAAFSGSRQQQRPQNSQSAAGTRASSNAAATDYSAIDASGDNSGYASDSFDEVDVSNASGLSNVSAGIVSQPFSSNAANATGAAGGGGRPTSAYNDLVERQQQPHHDQPHNGSPRDGMFNADDRHGPGGDDYQRHDDDGSQHDFAPRITVENDEIDEAIAEQQRRLSSQQRLGSMQQRENERRAMVNGPDSAGSGGSNSSGGQSSGSGYGSGLGRSITKALGLGNIGAVLMEMEEQERQQQAQGGNALAPATAGGNGGAASNQSGSSITPPRMSQQSNGSISPPLQQQGSPAGGGSNAYASGGRASPTRPAVPNRFGALAADALAALGAAGGAPEFVVPAPASQAAVQHSGAAAAISPGMRGSGETPYQSDGAYSRGGAAPPMSPGQPQTDAAVGARSTQSASPTEDQDRFSPPPDGIQHGMYSGGSSEVDNGIGIVGHGEGDGASGYDGVLSPARDQDGSFDQDYDRPQQHSQQLHAGLKPSDILNNARKKTLEQVKKNGSFSRRYEAGILQKQKEADAVNARYTKGKRFVPVGQGPNADVESSSGGSSNAGAGAMLSKPGDLGKSIRGGMVLPPQSADNDVDGDAGVAADDDSFVRGQLDGAADRSADDVLDRHENEHDVSNNSEQVLASMQDTLKPNRRLGTLDEADDADASGSNGNSSEVDTSGDDHDEMRRSMKRQAGDLLSTTQRAGVTGVDDQGNEDEDEFGDLDDLSKSGAAVHAGGAAAKPKSLFETTLRPTYGKQLAKSAADVYRMQHGTDQNGYLVDNDDAEDEDEEHTQGGVENGDAAASGPGILHQFEDDGQFVMRNDEEADIVGSGIGKKLVAARSGAAGPVGIISRGAQDDDDDAMNAWAQRMEVEHTQANVIPARRGNAFASAGAAGGAGAIPDLSAGPSDVSSVEPSPARGSGSSAGMSFAGVRDNGFGSYDILRDESDDMYPQNIHPIKQQWLADHGLDASGNELPAAMPSSFSVSASGAAVAGITNQIANLPEADGDFNASAAVDGDDAAPPPPPIGGDSESFAREVDVATAVVNVVVPASPPSVPQPSGVRSSNNNSHQQQAPSFSSPASDGYGNYDDDFDEQSGGYGSGHGDASPAQPPTALRSQGAFVSSPPSAVRGSMIASPASAPEIIDEEDIVEEVEVDMQGLPGDGDAQEAQTASSRMIATDARYAQQLAAAQIPALPPVPVADVPDVDAFVVPAPSSPADPRPQLIAGDSSTSASPPPPRPSTGSPSSSSSPEQGLMPSTPTQLYRLPGGNGLGTTLAASAALQRNHEQPPHSLSASDGADVDDEDSAAVSSQQQLKAATEVLRKYGGAAQTATSPPKARVRKVYGYDADADRDEDQNNAPTNAAGGGDVIARVDESDEFDHDVPEETPPPPPPSNSAQLPAAHPIPAPSTAVHPYAESSSSSSERIVTVAPDADNYRMMSQARVRDVKLTSPDHESVIGLSRQAKKAVAETWLKQRGYTLH